jgi:hypothetical protein
MKLKVFDDIGKFLQFWGLTFYISSGFGVLLSRFPKITVLAGFMTENRG